jgi:O-antigen/teichoic acid export membrane protein
MVASFVMMRWVDPEQWGLWQSLLLVQTYSTIVQAGVFNGLNRELPYRLGRGDPRALELVSTGQGFAWLVVGLLGLGAVISVFVSDDPNIRYVLPAVFLASACAIYMQFLGATYRSSQSFQKLALINLIEGIASIATLPLIYFLQYPGLPVRYLVLGFVSVAVRHRWRPYHVKTRLDFRMLGTLLAVGVPLYVFGYVTGIAGTLPQVILLSRGSVEMVGLYAPASAMIGLMTMVPSAIAQYVYPRMSHRLGETGDPRSLWPMAWKTSFAFMAFAVPVLVVAFFAVPPLIRAFLPEYVQAVPSVKWTLVSGVFLGASISVNALNSLKAWRWMSVYTLARLAMSFVLPLCFFYVFSDHIEGVALGYAVTQSICFVVALVCIHRATRDGKGHQQDA